MRLSKERKVADGKGGTEKGHYCFDERKASSN